MPFRQIDGMAATTRSHTNVPFKIGAAWLLIFFSWRGCSTDFCFCSLQSFVRTAEYFSVSKNNSNDNNSKRSRRRKWLFSVESFQLLPTAVYLQFDRIKHKVKPNLLIASNQFLPRLVWKSNRKTDNVWFAGVGFNSFNEFVRVLMRLSLFRLLFLGKSVVPWFVFPTARIVRAAQSALSPSQELRSR